MIGHVQDRIDGVRACPDPETAVEEVAKTVFKLPGND